MTVATDTLSFAPIPALPSATLRLYGRRRPRVHSRDRITPC